MKWEELQLKEPDEWSVIAVKEVQVSVKDLSKCKRLNEFKVDEADRHDLPCELIRSRLCHAEIWGKFALAKRTTAILIVLSKRSRAFILTQRLKGFLINHHTCY